MSAEKKDHLSEKGAASVFLASLRGISQVLFIENAVSGVVILIAIMVSSWSLGVIALLSSIIGTLIGKIGGAPATSINNGLYGYNSVLAGMAMTLFLTGSSKWIIALIAAAITAIFAATIVQFMKNVELPILTIPFILLTWFMLLVSYRLKAFHLSESLVPQSLAYWELEIAGKVNWVEGFFAGIGQIFFLDHPLSGAILFIAVFLGNWRWGIVAVIGNTIGLLLAYGLGGEHSLIFRGLYGYNTILSCMAVAVVFGTAANRFRFISGIVAACVSVLLTASVFTWILPYGLPVLTLPFVLTTWLFLGARKILTNL
ncbi:urea transporter [Ureibacillus yapensis]|nr:urea transporter [Lysinibacillus yapensis]